jgi:glucosamine-6-phosphate deaminase
MKLIKVQDYKELSEIACKIIIEDISKKPNIAIGFATGKTPLGLYKELIKSYKEKKVDFSKIKSFNLDEYYPIKKKNKNSYHYYMIKNLLSRVNIKKSNINFLNGETKNPEKECLNYERKIKKNPLDIVILGVGVNGHIGFNEPGSLFNSKTRIVNLSPDTLGHNSKYFKNKKNIPKQALTIGLKTIFSSKKIILLASGKEKSKAIGHLTSGNMDKNWPVSMLRKHKNLIVIIDKGVV